jgi:hypothetical protein
MKTHVLFVLAGISLYLCGGCAGRNPSPVPIQMRGDEKVSCETLLFQKQYAEQCMRTLESKRNKFVTNAFWLVVFPPLIDPKDAEKVEYEAWKNRSAYLTSLMINKGCIKEKTNAQLAEANAPTEVNSPIEDKPEFVVGAAKCSLCGRDIGKDETFCLYKLKRVCPQCFAKH